MKLTKQQALEKIEELKAFIEQEDSKRVWKPSGHEKYFVIAGNGEVCMPSWSADNEDYERWEMGNVYRTREEAKAAVTKQKALVRINRYIEEHFGKWEPDWESTDEYKYHITYRHYSKSFTYEYCQTLQFCSLIPFLKEESHAEQLIEDMEGDLRCIFQIS